MGKYRFSIETYSARGDYLIIEEKSKIIFKIKDKDVVLSSNEIK